MLKFTSFDGIEIAYQTWGDTSQLPSVLLHHGFIANADINWVRPGIVEALTRAGRRVVALDARGHGASGKPYDPAFYGEDKMARDLIQIIDLVVAATGQSVVDLVGYSMGAIVSLIAASRDSRIRRLVIGGVGAGVVEQGGLDTRAVAGGLLVSALRAPDPGDITQPIPRAFRALADALGADREALAAVATARRSNAIPVGRITAPALVIAGESDPLAVRPEVLAAAISNARLLRLPGDHLSVVRDPGFAAAIVDFLGSQ
jgi:pimeloyl-ACP methyl ester carboxylesterase